MSPASYETHGINRAELEELLELELELELLELELLELLDDELLELELLELELELLELLE